MKKEENDEGKDNDGKKTTRLIIIIPLSSSFSSTAKLILGKTETDCFEFN